MNLVANNLSITFNNKKILDNFNITVNSGDYICLTGKSGSGKTTILNILSGMLKPDNGNVLLDDIDIFKDLSEEKRTLIRNKKIGYLNSGNCLLENLTVYENILYPLLLQKNNNEEKIDSVLEKLQILDIKNSYPNQISSGEYKRVCFARVLVLDTDILLLDEPTSNLDEESANIIIKMIDELNGKKSFVIATHDKDLVKGKNIEINKNVEKK